MRQIRALCYGIRRVSARCYPLSFAYLGAHGNSVQARIDYRAAVDGWLAGLAYAKSKVREWISKFVNEPSFDHDQEIWVRLTRTMYRGGQYTETVVDPANGEVLHHQSHPLAEHTGHGGDKPRQM